MNVEGFEILRTDEETIFISAAPVFLTPAAALRVAEGIAAMVLPQTAWQAKDPEGA